MPIGLILTLFTTSCLFSIWCFNHKTKKIFNNYWFYAILNAIFLSCFLAFRWSKDLISWMNNDYRGLIGQMDVIKSKVLLLDMCPFNAVLLSLFLIFDRKRYLASSISIISFIGGVITIYGQVAFETIGDFYSTYYDMTWWEYTFGNDLYFILHFYLTIMSMIVLMNSKAFNFKKIVVSHIYVILFFVYISTISFTLNIEWNVTGIRPNDWGINGEYEVIGKILNLPWPWIPVISFMFIWLINLIIFQIRNIMVLDKNYLYKKLWVSYKLKDEYVSFIQKVFFT